MGFILRFPSGQCRWPYTVLVLTQGIWSQLECFPDWPQSTGHILSLHPIPEDANGIMLPAPRAPCLRVSAGCAPAQRVGQKHWGMSSPGAALTGDELKWVDWSPTFLASQQEHFWGTFYTISQRPWQDLTKSPTKVTCPLMHPILAFSNSLSHFSTSCLESTSRDPNLTCFLDFCLPLLYKMSSYQIKVELELLSHLALYRPSGWRKDKKVGLRPFLSTKAEAISMCFTSCFTSIIPFELKNLKLEKILLKIMNLGKLIFTYWNPICISFLLLL